MLESKSVRDSECMRVDEWHWQMPSFSRLTVPPLFPSASWLRYFSGWYGGSLDPEVSIGLAFFSMILFLEGKITLSPKKDAQKPHGGDLSFSRRWLRSLLHYHRHKIHGGSTSIQSLLYHVCMFALLRIKLRKPPFPI